MQTQCQRTFIKKLKEESPNSISELQQASFLNVKVAAGQTVKALAQVDVKFKVNDHNFQDSFLILPSMNSVVLGNPFFKKYPVRNQSWRKSFETARNDLSAQ